MSQFDLLFGAESLTGQRTGVGNYAYQLYRQLAVRSDLGRIVLVSGLRALSPEVLATATSEPEALAERSIPFWRQALQSSSLAQAVHRQACRWRLRALRARVLAGSGLPVCYHEPNMIVRAYDGICISTFHDLTWLHYPETHPEDRIRWIERHLAHTLSQVNRIITDSEFVRGEVIRHLGVPEDRVEAVPLGVSPDYRPRTRGELLPVLRKYDLDYREYVLAVGTIEPRKNLARLLHSHRRLPTGLQRRYPLVIVGKSGWRNDAVLELMADMARLGTVRQLGYVADNEVPQLYAGARAVAYVSLYEGYGLPALEGMASGVPVLASRSSSIPEVVGDAARLVDPLDEDDILSGLRSALEDDAGNAVLMERGLSRAALRTWPACAERTVAVYRRALSG